MRTSFGRVEPMYESGMALYIVGIDIFCAKSATPCPTSLSSLSKAAIVSCAAGFADVLQAANAHLRHQQGSDLPALRMVFRFRGRRVRWPPATGCRSRPSHWTAAAGSTSSPFPRSTIPASSRSSGSWTSRPQTYEWLRSQWKAGAWIGANCTGTFMLAQSGLLDGRAATTTWWLDQQFRSRYPKVDLHFRSVLTEADRLVCAGATATYLLQAVRMVDRFMGPHIAITVREKHADRHQPHGPDSLPAIADRDEARGFGRGTRAGLAAEEHGSRRHGVGSGARGGGQ